MAAFEFESLIIPATRYYMGRMTIHTTVHAEALAHSWRVLPPNVKKIIRSDLESAFGMDDRSRARGDDWRPLGMDCDRAAWEKVREAWLAEDRARVSEDVPT